jgi:UTP--glucose-1-phosphate uridylyltransferase
LRFLLLPSHKEKETAAMHLRSIIIPAAGLGTRMLPATKAVPKELLNVYDRPILQFAIDEAVEAGAERIVVVVSPDKAAIRDYLKRDENYIGRLRACGKAALSTAMAAVQVPETVQVLFAVQNTPLGLGHAIACCRTLVLPGSVGVILPDDVIMGAPCMSSMVQAYVSGHMIAAMTVPALDAQRYGIFQLLGSETGRSVAVSNMVEKPKAGTEPSLLAAVGRYILDPIIFETLQGIARGAGGEIQLTDAIDDDAGRLALTAFRFSGQRYDCGNHDGLMAAAIARQRAVKDQQSKARKPIGSEQSAIKINEGFPVSRHVDDLILALEGNTP